MDKASWMEVSLNLNGEMAEAVSEVLNRYVSNGVVIESKVRFNDEEDEGTAYGDLHMYGYIPVDENLEETRTRLQESLWHLRQIQNFEEASFRTIDDEDWMASWKKHYNPIPVGKKLVIVPVWVEMEFPGKTPVKINPNMAFGTGTHPTTQLCLEMVEKYTLPGKPVIDVGCGSGILSIAAIKCGASRAGAVDIDAAAVISTRENAEINQVQEKIITAAGSVAEVKQGEVDVKKAPLVLANILAPVIVRLFNDGLADLVSSPGIIILSGILAEQSPSVINAALSKGLRLIERRQQEDWVVLVLAK